MCGDFSTAEVHKFQFNSQSCLAHTLSNMAVVYLLISTKQPNNSPCFTRCTKAAQKCIEMALKAMPAGEGSEAYINMNNVMRQMGCKAQAFEYTWLSVAKSFGQGWQTPQPYKCAEDAPSSLEGSVSFVCVKYGTKYGADYVNKLYQGVKDNCSLPFTFSCFTEDATGLDRNVLVKPLKNKWQGWWSKVHIFDPAAFEDPQTRVFYIDLDMIIAGSLD